ncbi:retrovirus-related pol polyprotein from transposon TNT 1-94 [Tanacetum coccineum]
MELKTSSSFKTTGLLRPWQKLCKIFFKCLTTRVTGWDQPPLQIMQMMYCFVNNIHVDYAKLLWEGLYYSIHHPISSIPYLRFTKIIISHYMTCFPDISRRARDMYHNLQDDDIMKNIFNSGRHKDKVGMQIPDWMITEEMKHMEHYRMYTEVFGLDVPLTQSQPTESTQGTHRTPNAPRSPNLKMDTTKSSAPKRSTMIHFLLPERRSTLSLAEHKSREEQEARENVELVNNHLASEEIEKMMEGSENVIDDSLSPRNDEPNIPGTRLEPRSDKESQKVEITNDEKMEITNVDIPVNVNEEEGEITDEGYELKRMEKGKIVEESRSTPFPTPIRSPKIYTNLISSDTEKLQELTVTDTKTTSSSKSLSTKLSKINRLLSLFKAKPAQVMVESLPTMVDTHIKEQLKKQVPEQVRDQVLVYVAEGLILERQKTKEEMERMIAKMKFERLQVPQTTCRTYVVCPRDQDDPRDDAHPEGENSAKSQKTSEYKAYVSEESSFEQVNEEERGPSTLGNQEQVDDCDFWTDSYASGDDEIPTKQVSQDIMKEVSLTTDEAKLKKMADEMLRQRCTSGDEHQHHIDQMKNFLKSDINPHAKIFYIRKQKEPGKLKEVIYSNLKIIQVIKTYWELGHEHKIIIKIVARRANECIMSITDPDYKNLNKNDIKDMYLLIMNGKKVNLTAPTISFPRVEKHKMLSIIYGPVHGIIYKNSKKEKRVMRHSEIHKFYDATLIIVLEGLKSYNNDIKYGYVQRELTNDEVEYLKLFEEEIEVSQPDEKIGDFVIRRVYPSKLDVTSQAIVLDDACLMERDFSSSLMRKIKDINAMPNLYLILANEGFENVKITHLGVKSNVTINDKVKVIVKGKIFWILLKELKTWSLKFIKAKDDDLSSEDESVEEDNKNNSENIENDFELDNDNELYHVSESTCMHENDRVYKKITKGTDHSNKSDDAFGIYKILKRNNDKVASESLDPQFPPGVSTATGGYNGVWKLKSGGSLLDVMDELIKVGQIMGYNIKGCMKNIEAIIGSQGDGQKKLQALMTSIKQWIKDDKLCSSSAKESIQNHLFELDKLTDQGRCNDGLVNERSKLLKELQDLNSCASLDMMQKAKIRWAMKGDENSKYFHGIINKKRSQRAIRGVLIEGDWIFPNTLSLDQQTNLERYVSYDEIKKAVWDCGINKSPGPWCNSSFIALIPKTQEAKVVKDSHPISLTSNMYKIIAKILANHLSFVISSLISDVQLAFVSNQQILDGPFILNELLLWGKHKKSKAMVFKVNFEKAFDLMIWDYLDDVLNKFSFEDKWRD